MLIYYITVSEKQSLDIALMCPLLLKFVPIVLEISALTKCLI